MDRTFRIPRLKSGGLITTYHCVSRCGHCLYNCGPTRDTNYMDIGLAESCFERVKSLGVRTMHIGGGEPVLRPDLLGEILEISENTGVSIEYVETNAAWFTGHEKAFNTLKRLKDSGLSAFLVSISPFHNAYIPYERVIGLNRACRDEGIGVIPWSGVFNPLLSRCDPSKTHDWETLEKTMGSNLAAFVMNRYWLHPGGRALDFFRTWGAVSTVGGILSRDRYGCEKALTDTSHFHVDLYGQYIPGLCAGLSIALDDLDAPLNPSAYPLICTLMARGINGLYDLPAAEYGYVPLRGAYAGKCDLCHEIRKHLVLHGWAGSRELSQVEHYINP